MNEQPQLCGKLLQNMLWYTMYDIWEHLPYIL